MAGRFAVCILYLIAQVEFQTVRANNRQCDNKFDTFFQCLSQKFSAPQTAQNLEREFDQGFVNLVDRCFSPNNGLAQSKQQCVLDRSTMNIDTLGSDGPLRGCGFCQKIGKVIHDKYFGSTRTERKCIRERMLQVAIEDVQSCMRNKLHDFSYTVPSIPDLDAASDDLLDMVKDALKHRIWAKSRLDVCAQINPLRAGNTRNCINTGQHDMYKQTCDIISSCKDNSASCQNRFNQLKTVACDCIHEKNEEMSQRIDSLREAILTSTSSSECSRRIESAIGRWKNELIGALKNCFSGEQQGLAKIPATKLVEIGCLRASQLNEGGKKELAIGFRFLRNFLEVMLDRSTRFCSCQ